MNQIPMRFDGKTIVPQRDNERLGEQFVKVKSLMLDGMWRTLEQIAEAVGAPAPSVSARLRDLRKERFGGYQVERRYIAKGLFEYRIVR